MKDIISEDEFSKLSLDEQRKAIIDLLETLPNEVVKEVYEEVKRVSGEED